MFAHEWSHVARADFRTIGRNSANDRANSVHTRQARCDAVGTMYGSSTQGTVDRLSGETHAWVRWDDDEGPLDLVHIDDLDVIA